MHYHTLDKIRTSLRLTPADFAQLLGITTDQYYRYSSRSPSRRRAISPPVARLALLIYAIGPDGARDAYQLLDN